MVLLLNVVLYLFVCFLRLVYVEYFAVLLVCLGFVCCLGFIVYGLTLFPAGLGLVLFSVCRRDCVGFLFEMRL